MIKLTMLEWGYQMDIFTSTLATAILPPDCWLEIFSHLDLVSLGVSSRVCYEFQDLISTVKYFNPAVLQYERLLSNAARLDYINIIDWITSYRRLSFQTLNEVLYRAISSGSMLVVAWVDQRYPHRGLPVSTLHRSKINYTREMYYYLRSNGVRISNLDGVPFLSFSDEELLSVITEYGIEKISNYAASTPRQAVADRLNLFINYLSQSC
jgi:hypothetical protein